MSFRALADNPWALLILPAGMYLALTVAVTMRRSWSGEIKLAVAGTGVVLIAVWLMSFAALMAFFAAAYVEPPLNALGPVAVDGEMAVGTVVWIAIGQGGVRLAEITGWRDGLRWVLSPRPYVALLVAVSAALSSVANAVHPLTSVAGYHLPAPWSYAGSAVPGVVMFAVIHQLVILFRVVASPATPATPATVVDAPAAAVHAASLGRPAKALPSGPAGAIERDDERPSEVPTATLGEPANERPSRPAQAAREGRPTGGAVSGPRAAQRGAHGRRGERPVGGPTERPTVAEVAAHIKAQLDAGSPLKDITKAAVGRELGLPRSTAQRMYDDALDLLRAAPDGPLPLSVVSAEERA